jgi:hypothetical protein
MDAKWQQVAQALQADPADYLVRVLGRFLGATMWYEPFHRDPEGTRPWVVWASRLTHPLPFLGAVLLLCCSLRRPLRQEHWVILGVYAVYLLPYVLISYYPRYAMPLLGVKILLTLAVVDWLIARWGIRPADEAPAVRRYQRRRPRGDENNH